MTRTLCLVLLTALLPTMAAAQGLVFPNRWFRPDGQPMPGEPKLPPLAVKSIKVDTKIVEQVAKTHVDQVFHNPTPYRLEGQYLFLLPREASVSEFALYIDGKKQEGELLEKEKAKGIYEGIVRRMQDPALLEYMGSNVFQARIFPIEPNSERRIEMTYQSVLPRDFNLVRYTYPIHTPTQIGQSLGEFVINVNLTSKVPLKNLYSPTHTAVAISRKGETEANVSFEGKNVATDQDFTLYWAANDQDVGINLLTYRPDSSEDGYFLVLLSPKAELKKGEVMAKDIVFVLDTSGSMQGKRIQQAKKSLKFCVQSLNREDRFNIIPFATEANVFADNLLEANDANLSKAADFIDKEVRAAGGTNVNEALLEALKRQPPERKRPYIVCFITDGEPTVGVTEPKEIVENIKKANASSVRVFTLGIGNDLNTKLVDEVASATNASSEYVKEEEDIELKISNLYNRISSPVLADLKIGFGALKTSDVYPKKLPDLFRGSQLTVVGRYKAAASVAVQLSGIYNGSETKFAYDASFPETASENEFLPRIWATRKVGYLLEEIRLHGENAELKDEVIRLAKRYAIVTPYTSYLVVEDVPIQRAGPGVPMSEPMINAIDDGRRRAGAAPMVEERELKDEAAGAPAPSALKAREEFSSTSGAGAVRMSQRIAAMKTGKADVEQERVGTAGSGIRKVGAKTFLFQGGRWVDTAIAEQKGSPEKLEIKYGSNAYFKLIGAYHEIARFAAIGKKLELAFRGKIIVIDESSGQEEISDADLDKALGKP